MAGTSSEEIFKLLKNSLSGNLTKETPDSTTIKDPDEYSRIETDLKKNSKFVKYFFDLFIKQKNEYEEKFIEYKKQIDDLEKKNTDKFEEYETKIEDTQKKVTESIGIFVAIFSFVSIEFNFLKQTSSSQTLVKLTLILSSILLFFICILSIFMRCKFSIFTVLVLIFALISIGLLSLGLILPY